MPGVPEVAAIYGAERQGPPVDSLDLAIARIAARQHGVIWLEQLRHLGLSDRAVRSRVAAGRLHRIHRGVYAVGHPQLTHEGRWLAAVRAYGHAALSHRSGVEHHKLLPRRPRLIDVSVPRLGAKSRNGIRVHCTTTMLRRDVTVKDAIPVTTVARTLLDFAEQASESELREAVEQAAIERVLDLTAIRDVLSRSQGRKGAPSLSAAVGAYNPISKQTKSKLERSFLRMLAAAGLPEPLVNKPLKLPNGITIKPDFHWPEQRLILETDGKETHMTPFAFERDRRRDQQLTLMGIRCPRTTWLQLEDEPEVVVAMVAELIARAA